MSQLIHAPTSTIGPDTHGQGTIRRSAHRRRRMGVPPRRAVVGYYIPQCQLRQDHPPSMPISARMPRLLPDTAPPVLPRACLHHRREGTSPCRFGRGMLSCPQVTSLRCRPGSEANWPIPRREKGAEGSPEGLLRPPQQRASIILCRRYPKVRLERGDPL